jgi:tripartite-type tricarboxylate transporter receptor subunit TctC
VQKLHDAIIAVLAMPLVQEWLKTIGTTLVAPERRSPEYLQQFVASEVEKWAGPIKSSGAQID